MEEISLNEGICIFLNNILKMLEDPIFLNYCKKNSFYEINQQTIGVRFINFLRNLWSLNPSFKQRNMLILDIIRLLINEPKWSKPTKDFFKGHQSTFSLQPIPPQNELINTVNLIILPLMLVTTLVNTQAKIVKACILSDLEAYKLLVSFVNITKETYDDYMKNLSMVYSPFHSEEIQI